MHRAEDDEARPGFKAVEIERFEVDVAGVNGHGRFSHAYESWKVAASRDSVPYILTERPPAKNYRHRCVRHRTERPSTAQAALHRDALRAVLDCGGQIFHHHPAPCTTRPPRGLHPFRKTLPTQSPPPWSGEC